MKQDWNKSRKRFKAWWHGEVADRVLLQVFAPANDTSSAPPPPAPPKSLEQQWLDVDYRAAVYESRMNRTYYGGDAFPYLDTHIGPGTLSLYLGSTPTLAPTTVWYNKRFDDITTAELPHYDENNRFWKFSVELARKCVERFAGRAMVSMPDLIEGLDTVSSLVGNDELLYYLVDAPEHIHRFQKAITPLYFEYFDRLYDIIKDEHGGCCFSAFQTYAPGKMAKVQCDFSAMISPKMFGEFVVPYLAEQCGRLDYSVFHLDGPCCLQHLPLLLDIKELNAIQWTPGPGMPTACSESYVPIYRQIRASGKSIMVRGGSPDEARKLVEALGPEGLDIVTWAPNQDEADEIVKQSFGWKKL